MMKLTPEDFTAEGKRKYSEGGVPTLGSFNLTTGQVSQWDQIVFDPHPCIPVVYSLKNRYGPEGTWLFRRAITPE